MGQLPDHHQRQAARDDVAGPQRGADVPAIEGRFFEGCRYAIHRPQQGQQRALAQQPTPHVEIRTERDPSKMAPVHVRDAVVLGEPLIDARVVRVQQVEDAAVFLNHAVEEHLELGSKRVAKIRVEIGIQQRNRAALRQLPHAQPLTGKVADARLCSAVGEPQPDLLLENE